LPGQEDKFTEEHANASGFKIAIDGGVKWEMSQSTRKPYSSDVSDEEWALVAPYLTLLPEDCRQHRHSLREVFNAMRWMVRAGAPWHLSPA
jgi:hypothetical protein